MICCTLGGFSELLPSYNSMAAAKAMCSPCWHVSAVKAKYSVQPRACVESSWLETMLLSFNTTKGAWRNELQCYLLPNVCMCMHGGLVGVVLSLCIYWSSTRNAAALSAMPVVLYSISHVASSFHRQYN